MVIEIGYTYLVKLILLIKFAGNIMFELPLIEPSTGSTGSGVYLPLDEIGMKYVAPG